MKEQILEKVKELFSLLQEAKVPANFIAEMNGETIKVTNVDNKTIAQLMIMQLDDDDLRDHFLAEMEYVTAEVPKKRETFQEKLDKKIAENE